MKVTFTLEGMKVVVEALTQCRGKYSSKRSDNRRARKSNCSRDFVYRIELTFLLMLFEIVAVID